MNLVRWNPADLSVSIDGSFDALKEQALTLAAGVGVVDDPETNARATAAMRACKGLCNEMEKARKRVTDPLLDLQRKLKAAADGAVAEVKSEYERIDRATADYQTAETDRVRELERKRQDEIARVERERLEALAVIERERLQAERIARQQAENKAAEERARIEQERRENEAKVGAAAAAEAAAKAQQEAEARAEAERQRIAAAAEAAAKEAAEIAVARASIQVENLGGPAERVRSEGQTVKTEIEFETTDIHLLYRHHPNCVTLTESRQAIRDLINAGVRQIKGVRMWEATKVSTRQRQPKTITV